jgi:hypothetical protein
MAGLFVLHYFAVWRIRPSAATLSRMFRRRISFALIALSLTFLSSCTLWSQPKNSSWKNATGAEQYERLLWQAIKEKDWLNVESHLASNFVYMEGSGTRDKQQRVKYLHELPPFTDISIGDVNVTANGNDAIVTYTLALKTAQGSSAPSRVMSVWQQQKSGWVLVAMTEMAAQSK